MSSYPAQKHNGKYTHKTATCKRCGATNVVWEQNKEGKWYLVEHSGVGTKEDGWYYLPWNIHKCKK